MASFVLSCDSHIISVKLQNRGIIYISQPWPSLAYVNVSQNGDPRFISVVFS